MRSGETKGDDERHTQTRSIHEEIKCHGSTGSGQRGQGRGRGGEGWEYLLENLFLIYTTNLIPATGHNPED